MKKINNISVFTTMIALFLSFGFLDANAQVDNDDMQPETYTLKAEVVDWETGDPLPEAQVVVINMKELNTVTDGQGEFELENLAEDTYTIKIVLEGYKTWEKEIPIDADKELTIKLKPEIV